MYHFYNLKKSCFHFVKIKRPRPHTLAVRNGSPGSASVPTGGRHSARVVSSDAQWAALAKLSGLRGENWGECFTAAVSGAPSRGDMPVCAAQ